MIIDDLDFGFNLRIDAKLKDQYNLKNLMVQEILWITLKLLLLIRMGILIQDR